MATFSISCNRFFRNVSKREGAKGLQIVLALGGLCFSMILCMEVGQFCRSDYKNIDQQAAEYLTERGNEAGMAIKDASYPVTAWSKGEFFSMPYVAVTEEGKLGYRQYDTVLEYVSGDIAIRDQQVANMDKAIISKYGDYEESIYFLKMIELHSQMQQEAERSIRLIEIFDGL